jgi:uncharacterized membrane protein
MRLTWRTEWPHWGILVLLLIILTLSPERNVPIHWNIQGQVDRFADKWIAFALIVGLYVLLAVLPRLDPGRANYAQFAGAYGSIRLAILTVLAVLTGSEALGLRAEGLVHVAIGAMLVVLGSVMGKIRPNWFVGIRTPWTLTSKRSWLKTHRLGGWLFMIWGFIEIVVGLVFPTAGIVTLVTVLAVVVVLLAYSYVVWRDDPDKLAVLGTQPANGEMH